jgi:uncharacterized protein (DUF433 family)
VRSTSTRRSIGFVGLRGGTARRWINGYERVGRFYEPILRVAPKDAPWATWGEFVDTRFLAEYRDRIIPTARLRAAVVCLRAVYGLDYPLAYVRPYLSVHNRDLTISGEDVGTSDGEMVVRTGQILLGDKRSWTLIKRAKLGEDETGEAAVIELPADMEFPEIVINPNRYSGQPTSVGRRVSVATIAGMAASGERPEDLAADYGLSLEQIDAAVEYTKKYKLAE